jgi:predicted alpha/beta superfamily hydrolase
MDSPVERVSWKFRSKLLPAVARVSFALVAAICSAAAVIPAGEQLTLHSEILGEDRTIFVALPTSYATGTDRYPVLYLTDAQWQFAQTRTSAEFLARNGLIPEMIIVGITNPDRVHDLYATRADFKQGTRVIPLPTSGNGDQFLEFIAKEMIPWTEKAYRTSGLRIFAGHSAGGLFALHAMRVKPGLFQAVIAASPWLAWDDRKELTQLVRFLTSQQVQLRTLFFSYADEGAEMKANVEALSMALQSRGDSALRWNSRSYPEETHDSTVIKSYFDGLRMIFANYNCPRDPNTNMLLGSLDDLKSHFVKLSEQLGAPLNVPELLVNELGYDYLQTGRSEQALAIFRFNVERHPQSANAWDSLADGHERRGETTDALASYRKAVELAEAQRDMTGATAFRKHLDRLLATPQKSPSQ